MYQTMIHRAVYLHYVLDHSIDLLEIHLTIYLHIVRQR